MNTNVKIAIRLGVKIFTGISTGYFVLKLTEKRADELIQEGGAINALAIGTGQGALASVLGILAANACI